MSNTTYRPHKFQQLFHKSNARYRGNWAGRRGGKNIAGQVEDMFWLDRGRSDCCQELVSYKTREPVCPGCRKNCKVIPVKGLLVEPRFQDVDDIVMPIFRQFLGAPGGAIWEYFPSKHRMEINEWSGKTFVDKHAEKPTLLFDSAEYPDRLGHGKAFDFVHFDEIRDHKDFMLGFETVRPTLADRNGYFWGTTTANGEDPAYIYFKQHAGRITRAKDMLSMEPQEPVRIDIEDGHEDHELFMWRTIDNPYIDPKEIDDAKRTMTPQMFRQEWMASIEQFRGLVYPDYNPRKHFVEPVEIDVPLWFLGIDFGWNHPTGIVLVGESVGHTLFVVDEIEDNQKDAAQVHQMAVDLLERNNLQISDLEYAVFDTSGLQHEISSGGMSVYEQLLDPSVIGTSDPLPLQMADKAVMAGIMRVSQLFRLGGLKLFNRCVKLDKQLRGYRWPEKLETTLGNKDLRPIKKNDDLADPLRYVAMSRPDWFARKDTDRYGKIIDDGGGWEQDNLIDL